jgi:hypothetical protein
MKLFVTIIATLAAFAISSASMACKIKVKKKEQNVVAQVEWNPYYGWVNRSVKGRAYEVSTSGFSQMTKFYLVKNNPRGFNALQNETMRIIDRVREKTGCKWDGKIPE